MVIAARAPRGKFRRLAGLLEEVHHLGGDFIFVLQMNRFDDGFRRGAMSAAGVGEVEDNVRLSKRLLVHVVHLRVW